MGVRREMEGVRVDRRVVGRYGMLTRHGARVLLRDLWEHTDELLWATHGFAERAVGADEARDWDVEAQGWDVEELQRTIQRAIPVGARFGDGSWAVLYEVARGMMGWHAVGRSEGVGWQVEGDGEWPLGEAWEDVVGVLMEACVAERGG